MTTALAQRYLAQATVKPHWLSSPPGRSDTFWYRRVAASSSSSEFEFLLLDPESESSSSRRRPAFDHAALAAALAEQSGQDINPRSLPFAWIELDGPDGAAVRFWFDGRVWQFRREGDGAGGVLEGWEGDFGVKLVRSPFFLLFPSFSFFSCFSLFSFFFWFVPFLFHLFFVFFFPRGFTRFH
jgi:hypothetical protein